jgi:hypothetical protein
MLENGKMVWRGGGWKNEGVLGEDERNRPGDEGTFVEVGTPVDVGRWRDVDTSGDTGKWGRCRKVGRWLRSVWIAC